MSRDAQPPPGRDRAAAQSSTSKGDNTPNGSSADTASANVAPPSPWWVRLVELVTAIACDGAALDEDAARRLELLARWVRDDVTERAWTSGRFSVSWSTGPTTWPEGVVVDGEAAAIAAAREAELAGWRPTITRIVIDGGDGPGVVAGARLIGDRLVAT